MRWFLALHFAFCLLFALLAAALATGYPLPPQMNPADPIETTLHYEQTRVPDAAFACAIGFALLTAFVVRPRRVPRGIRFPANFVYVAIILAACHLLWVQPIWGFHHDRSLGVVGWLLLGEEGYGIMPNLFGAPLTLGCYAMLIWLSTFRAVPLEKLRKFHT